MTSTVSHGTTKVFAVKTNVKREKDGEYLNIFLYKPVSLSVTDVGETLVGNVEGKC